jgi:hypothetical protein
VAADRRRHLQRGETDAKIQLEGLASKPCGVYSTDQGFYRQAFHAGWRSFGVSRSNGMTALFARAKVITIFAHWRFVQIVDDDIVDPGEVLRRLRSAKEEIHKLIAEEVRRRSPGLLESATIENGSLRRTIASLLNEIASDANETYHREARKGGDGVFGTASARPILHRVTFELAFGEAIRHGSAIEMFDGMHTAAEFIAAVPAAFDGFLDLTLCHSMVLGMAVKQRRPLATVAFGVFDTDLRARIALYEIAIGRLACRSQPMIDVLTRIARRIET